ncbi:hypothetical protein [Thaumasiovibrio sp. DFM-14]|uniref:hypothetical protein n=1 Tax=Thaumasiovibrio sp. DFM-14 TaxID=3384792 RepID=UPI0039A045E8
MSAISLSAYAIQIGKNSGLEALRKTASLDRDFVSVAGYDGDVLSINASLSTHWLTRLLDNLEATLSHQPVEWSDGPVVVLAPYAFQPIQKKLLLGLQALLPPLKTPRAHKVFACGANALLRAANFISTQLDNHGHVWIVGMDIHPFFIDGSQPAQGYPTESVVIVKAQRAQAGLTAQWVHHELATDVSHFSLASSRVYTMAATRLHDQSPLVAIYPPYSLEDELVLSGIKGIDALGSHMNEEVKYDWMSAIIGDLGANLPLLQWLNIQHDFKHAAWAANGVVLQCARSINGYHSGALLGWQGA